MNINLYGYGFVGRAHYETLRHGNYINIIDPKFPNLVIPEFVPEAAIICVATPQSKDGSCDMTNVFDVMSQIPINIPVLIKSTISLEGWKELKKQHPNHSINFSPEYLRANNFLEDFQNMEMMYLSDDNPSFWAELFHPYWNNLKFVVGTAEQHILVKYFRNSFLASKVSFFNQVYDLCEATGIDYTEVSAGITQDPRIGKSHTEITTERGWGGHCFPKDTAAILKTAENYDVDLSLIKEVIDYNGKIRNENTDNRS